MSAGEMQTFELLHQAGLHANDKRKFAYGADLLLQAYNTAANPLQQVNALVPLARSEWNTNDLIGARQHLETAQEIAVKYDMPGEAAMALAGLGRLATIQALLLPRQERQTAIRDRALPLFQAAGEMLDKLEPPHPYYSYAAASYGALSAAAAGERELATEYLTNGLGVAFKKSHGHDEGKRPARISPAGLKRFLVAATMIPLGEYTPIFPLLARKLIK